MAATSSNDTSPQKEVQTGNIAEQWKQYMDTKKSKLMQQINFFDKKETVSEIFEGVSIFVNGYTYPPASELRRLIQLHGGDFHVYYEYGKTTYTVATHIASGKVAKLRKNEKIIHPKWIVDCIEAGERLPVEDYLLFKSSTQPVALGRQSSRRDFETRNAATDPNFISTFYERSRLHLISTLAQEMKQFVADLRSRPPQKFSSRVRLEHISLNDFLSAPEEVICHFDLDCYFVSVALRTRPDLIGRPVAITHSRGLDFTPGMSEVASCSYEARSCGVKNGMYVRNAKRLCPDLICLPYQFEDYKQTSKQIYEIISRYTLDIRAVSCDEMYVNLKGLCNEMQIMDVMAVVREIRCEIFQETKCNASAGVGPSMLIARLSTRHAKPNGQFIVLRKDIDSFIKKEKISSLPSIGYNIIGKLKELYGELETCEDLQTVSKEQLQNAFGSKMGAQIYNFCRGIDKEREFLENPNRKSISCDINYGIRFNKEEEMFDFLKTVAAELERKSVSAGMSASSVTLKVMIRSEDAPMETEKFLGHGVCDTVTRSSHLLAPTTSASVIFNETKKLMKSINPVISDLRGIGVQLAHLVKEKVPKIERSRQTLADFFKVSARGTRIKRKKTFTDNDDPLLQRAIRVSIREREEKELLRKKMMGAEPSYRGFSKDLHVKGEIFEILETLREPAEYEITALAQYFYRLAVRGEVSVAVSQLKFFERKALRCSYHWLIVVATLKELVRTICKRVYNLENVF